VSKWSHTDLLRLREGRVGAQLWTAYAECRSQHKGTNCMAIQFNKNKQWDFSYSAMFPWSFYQI
jgi:hypothetical protein